MSAETVGALAAFDAFMAAYTAQIRREFIDRGVTRLDVALVIATDKGVVVGSSNEKREQMVLLFEAGLRAARSSSATVIADGPVPQPNRQQRRASSR